MKNETELRAQIWEELAGTRFVMMGLEGKDDGKSQPMTLFIDDDAGPAYFFTTRDNRMATHMAEHPRGVVHFISKGQNFFACIHGQLSINNDPALIDRHWSPLVAAWYPGGRSDPNLVLVQFDPDTAEIWNHELSLLGKIKMLVGAKLKPEEIGAHTETTL